MQNLNNKQKVLNALKNKNFVKIISGIQNYDKQKSLYISMAAELGGATAIDICDDPEITKPIRALVQMPIFISSIDPIKLVAGVSHSADVLEIGNYEPFYKIGKMFTPSEIIELAIFVKKSISSLERPLDQVPLLSCTVPATLQVENQIKLAKELLNLGIDILQTEGFLQATPPSDRNDETYNNILKAASTLANTIELRKALPDAHIITASGITLTTIPLVLGAGANGIGIGTYISSITTQDEMTERVKEIMEKVNDFSLQPLQEKRKEFALR
jgi:hypothetical protein